MLEKRVVDVLLRYTQVWIDQLDAVHLYITAICGLTLSAPTMNYTTKKLRQYCSQGGKFM
jgi:hypothetical protein